MQVLLFSNVTMSKGWSVCRLFHENLSYCKVGGDKDPLAQLYYSLIFNVLSRSYLGIL
jgi:hypothetical protein